MQIFLHFSLAVREIFIQQLWSHKRCKSSCWSPLKCEWATRCMIKKTVDAVFTADEGSLWPELQHGFFLGLLFFLQDWLSALFLNYQVWHCDKMMAAEESYVIGCFTNCCHLYCFHSRPLLIIAWSNSLCWRDGTEWNWSVIFAINLHHIYMSYLEDTLRHALQ